MSTEPPLLLDTDFVSSFACVDRMDIIEGLYSGRMIVLEEVMVELERVPVLASRVRQSIEKGHIRSEVLLAGSKEALEFVRLYESGRYGAGESSCMSYLLCHEGTLASNNLRDVKRFCLEQRIELLTTPDVLRGLYEDGNLSREEADLIWREMVARKRKLPVATFGEYLAQSGE